MPFFAAIRIALVHHGLSAQPLGHVAPGRARADYPQQGITGWVRNRVDGSVEWILQGTKVQLADMYRWLRHGIPAARVDRLEVSEEPLPAPRLDNFDHLPTL